MTVGIDPYEVFSNYTFMQHYFFALIVWFDTHRTLKYLKGGNFCKAKSLNFYLNKNYKKKGF